MRLTLTLLSFLMLAAAAAQEHVSATWQGVQEGVHVRVTVIARGHRVPARVQQTQPWWRWGNTASDAYLFTFAQGEGTDLILDFSPSPSSPEVTRATLYRLTGRARLEVAPAPRTDRGYVLPAAAFPRFTVQPVRGGWWSEGKPNFNLETQSFEPFGDTFLEYQGRVQAAARGVPRWVQSRLVNDLSPSSGYARFNATVRADPEVPFRLATPLMPTWPYLSVTAARAHWGPNRPLVYETNTRRLDEYWAGFHVAGNYQFNSLSSPPNTDFEAPFAFYRFDPRAGNYANLVVRSDVWPASSPFGPPLENVSRTAVRMSWTAQAADLWRYSLTVLGNHEMTARVVIGETQVRAVPYRRFPKWVTQKPWKVVTFVEATAGEPGSEGIYDYSVEDNYPVSLWAQGARARVPATFDAPYLQSQGWGPTELTSGMRGEYSAVYRRVPGLYLSPVDRRLHLLYADGGVWNLGNEAVLRTANLDGDAYMDAWWRERIPPAAGPLRAQGGVREEALYRIGDLLIHAGPQGVTLRRSVFSPLLGKPPIPTDRRTWKLFLRRTALAAPARDPLNLMSWLEAFPGRTLELRGARLENLQSSPGELSFELTLGAGAPLRGALAAPIFRRLSPGTYVISYDRRLKLWSHETATPAKLSAHLKTSPLTTFTPGELVLSLHNGGSRGLSAEATLRLGNRVVKRWETVRLEGKRTRRETIAWAPERAGTWRATLKVGEQRLPLGVVTVAKTPRVSDVEAFFLPSGGRTEGVLVVLALTVLGSAAALWNAGRDA